MYVLLGIYQGLYIISVFLRLSFRLISISQLNTLTALTPLTYQPCCLQGVYYGYLILRWVSRLDAFSVYPLRTSLPGNAAGATTGTQ